MPHFLKFMVFKIKNLALKFKKHLFAVAGAQHALSALTTLLKDKGCTVQYGVHPVAGRMPGERCYLSVACIASGLSRPYACRTVAMENIVVCA